MNRLRVITLTLLVLVTVAGALPITETLAKWSRRSAAGQRKRHRRHSRAWWRRHRALMRARRGRAEQRRRLAGRAKPPAGPGSAAVNASLPPFAAGAAAPASGAPAGLPRTALLPFGFTPPHNWSPARKSRAGAAA